MKRLFPDNVLAIHHEIVIDVKILVEGPTHFTFFQQKIT